MIELSGIGFIMNPKVNTSQCLYNLVTAKVHQRELFMVRKKKSDEYEAKIQQALVVLGEDSTTPRNIRRSAKDAISALKSVEYTPAVRASNAVSMLDEILQDPNMPPYTRVKLWNVMSFIEAIKD
jgi:uncharacterized protein (UPF0147 family)